MNPLLLTDFYKVHHHNMYPEGTSLIYSNFTPRKSRIDGVDAVVLFGLQHFIKEYLIKAFNEEFFSKPWGNIAFEYAELTGLTDISHIKALHELGYLPIRIKALPEGTLVPIGVPCFTVVNTHPNFGWLTNYLETLVSTMVWQPITSATIAREYKKIVDKWALFTTGSTEGTEWQCHDFSMRGMSSVESAIISGMGHLTSFTGTDTIPAINQLKKSYNATGLIGASVPATEHSVMCMGTKDDELGTFRNLLNKYPSGILSVVSDTWNLWDVLTSYLPILKEEILARDGKLVIRPDSGDPVDIICGTPNALAYVSGSLQYKTATTPQEKGVIELLWDLFGGKVNDKGFKVLDPHIGAIYGDSITLERANEICKRLAAKGFASTNIVFGVGSYTYQYNTRDTFGFAMKATYGEVTKHNFPDGYDEVEAREIMKDPITDDGTKKSKKGLLQVVQYGGSSRPYVLDQQTKEQEEQGMLKTVFLDGKLTKSFTLEEVRTNIKTLNTWV